MTALSYEAACGAELRKDCWWKDWKGSKRAGRDVLYSLAITLHVLGEADVDIGTPIANQIGIEAPIEQAMSRAPLPAPGCCRH